MTDCLTASMFIFRRHDAETNNSVTESILASRTALPSFLIATRPRRRRGAWANVGFAAVALLLLALAVFSILYVGPSPFAGPAAPSRHSHLTLPG